MENSIIESSIQRNDESKLGCVYLLGRFENPSIVKIGYTSKSAEGRALNYTDGEWVVHKEYAMPIWLAKLTEQSAHNKLAEFWLNPKFTGGTASEIFICSLEAADTAIKTAYESEIQKFLKYIGSEEKLLSIKFEEDSNQNLQNLIIQKVAAVAASEDKIKHQNAELDAALQESRRIILSLQDEILYLRNVKNSLEIEVEKYKNWIAASRENFEEEIAILDSMAERKINLKDFEKVRDGFRRAIEIIKIMKITKELNN